MWLFAMMTLGCTSSGESLLEALDGTWTGSALVQGVDQPMAAQFTYTNFLSGDLQIREGSSTTDYGIRVADAFNGVVEVNLQQAAGIQFLLLDGGLSEDEGTFSGDLQMTFDCGKSLPCGYIGTFSLGRSGVPPIGATGTTGDTGPVNAGPTGSTGTTGSTGDTGL